MSGAMALGGAFRVLLSELAQVGLDPRAVCAAAGVDPRALDESSVALRVADVARVLACAEATADDPLLGLHLGEHARGRGVLAYLARAQRTVGEGLQAFAQYAGHAWGARDAVRVEARGERVFVGFAVGSLLPRHVADYLMARTAITLRRSGARPGEAWFREAAGGPSVEYERVLGCPVRFRRAETGLWLRADDMRRPLRTGSPEAAEALAAALTRQPARESPSVAVRLGAAVEDALARGQRVDRERLARALGMSGKTLARRLAGEARSFREVVDDVRRLLARRLVGEETLDLGEVAARVGFADGAAFGKAFRRWFGDSPSAFRSRRRSA
jgi:AraC-like DNA-binding protein